MMGWLSVEMSAKMLDYRSLIYMYINNIKIENVLNNIKMVGWKSKNLINQSKLFITTEFKINTKCRNLLQTQETR